MTGDQLAALLSIAATPATSQPVNSFTGADLTNSGNPDNANPSSAATASSTPPVVEATTTASEVFATELVLLDYRATTTLPASVSSIAK